jgi:hypothetical protein
MDEHEAAGLFVKTDPAAEYVPLAGRCEVRKQFALCIGYDGSWMRQNFRAER